MAARLQPLLRGGSYFESPRWHADRWWTSDVYAGQVRAVQPDGEAEVVLNLDDRPSGLGWLPNGDLLVVSMGKRQILRRLPDGSVSVHADLTQLVNGDLNDMVVDQAGRAYVGAVGFDLLGGETPRPSVLVSVADDGMASVAADGLMFPNGAVLTAGGTQLIVAETLAARYTRFDVAADGRLTNPQLWAEITPPFAPDGCAIDAAGRVWSADATGGPCRLLAPGGRVLDELSPPPGLTIFAAALGGPDGHTLLLCAAPDFDPAARRASRDSVLLQATVDTPAASAC